MKTYISSCISYLVKGLRIQLYINLLSLPILWYWQLPISLVSPITNLLFVPWLMLFLLLASIIFFTEACYVPNTIFIWMLEYVTESWFWLSAYITDSVLFVFTQPSLPYIIIVPLLVILLMKHTRLQSLYLSTLALFLFLIMLLGTTLIQQPKPGCYKIGSYMTAIVHNGYTILTVSVPPKSQYQPPKALVNKLLRHNIRKINLIIMQYADYKNFKLLYTLLRTISVNHVCSIDWHAHLPIIAWHEWISILEYCAQKGITIEKINRPTLFHTKYSTSPLATNLNPLYTKRAEKLEVFGAYSDTLFSI